MRNYDAAGFAAAAAQRVRAITRPMGWRIPGDGSEDDDGDEIPGVGSARAGVTAVHRRNLRGCEDWLGTSSLILPEAGATLILNQ